MTNVLDGKGKQTINDLYVLIEESKLQLSSNIEFDNDHRSIINVIDNDAEYSDESFLYTSHSAHDVFEFLKGNRYLK
jgi:hypothetical protein